MEVHFGPDFHPKVLVIVTAKKKKKIKKKLNKLKCIKNNQEKIKRK